MTVPHPQLGDGQREAVAAALCHVSAERLRELVLGVTAVPSPTGEERPLAEHIVRVLRETGIDADLQLIDERQANAVGRLHGAGDGAHLLLYAPIDTLTTGNPDEDLPWLAPQMPTDALPSPYIVGDCVVGLGASNPKGHVACILMAAEAIARARLALRGDLLLGFGAGGMPTNARELPGSHRRNTGQGTGCSFMLEQGIQADYAVIAKPGWAVAAEEVGLCWFDFRVYGTHTYVGSRHLMPYRNAIADAAEVIRRLESWFERYAERYATATITPQGIVSSIHAGWPRMAAVTPDVCWFRADLRITPDTSPMTAMREIEGFLREVGAELPGITIDMQMSLSIPGTATPADNWIVRSATAAWERLEGRPHEPPSRTSGATDANILRSRGVATARLGMPKVTDPELVTGFRQGMNTVDIRAMQRLTHALIEIGVDTTMRPRHELTKAAL
jgi:acetylornithine deacetylase/succinyl-diaminopimelate desuccinylase-like protein